MLHLSGGDGLGLLEALAEPDAVDLVGDHELVAGERFIRLFGIDIDQLDDPVAVGAAGRGEELRDDRADDVEILRQGLGLVAEHVGAEVDEPLILDQPLGPLAIRIERRDRPGVVGHGLGRVGDVLIEARLVVAGGRRCLERQSSSFVQEKPAARGPSGRPVVVRLPRVGPGPEADHLGEIAMTGSPRLFPSPSHRRIPCRGRSVDP